MVIDSISAIGLMKLAVEERVEDGEWRWRMQILREAVTFTFLAHF